MKYAAVVVLVFGFVSFARSASTYTDKFDKVDLDALVKNERLFKTYVNCLLDKGPCQPDGLELKTHLPDALLTECIHCTDAQKEGTRKVIRHLLQHKREWWNELEAKYDPKKVYVTKYRDELKKEGIEL
ncbi:ejaculatory bulb-specific protein 3-like [Coccinella septempunctata]|uniref:ejaculatory bulb-specific protein 3-like n=1 Tax=Coccinella septempunctata TaxID=41139 RepID=UPI001D06F7B6|nr:ejaculatory bulb-specific protein 3-like [Coccinella septempunctata]